MPSLMNGLSAMGGAISSFAGTAGLEQQKADLAQQGEVLANQLAMTRESAGRVQAGQIAATAAGVEQQFQGGQNTLQRQAAQKIAETGAGATTGAANIAAGAEIEAEKIRAGAPPDTVKLLEAIGALPPAGTPPVTGAPAGSAAGAGASTSGASGASGTTAGPSTGSASGAAASPSPMDNPIVQHVLGLPLSGSEAAGRMAIAQDVKNDPAFKYKTAGQQAAEVETRFQVASGKMTDPTERGALAAGIASYQLSPINQRARMMPGGPETMKEVFALNPNYQEARFDEINKAMTAFGTGSQGDTVRAEDVGVQHLALIDKAAEALANGDTHGLNMLKNDWNRYFGSAPPTTFDGLKQIVATEVQKAIQGGIGSDSDRQELKAALNSSNSLSQLQGMTNGFRSLMAGQLAGLKTQYENTTGFTAGSPFAFETKLSPETIQALEGSNTGAAPTSAGSTPTTGPTTSPTAADGRTPFAVIREAGAQAPRPTAGTPVPGRTPLATVRESAAPTQPAIPPWVKPGDLYSPSRGVARSPDGAVYGAPQ